MKRIKAEDLRFAAEWCRAYEGDVDDDDNMASAERMAEWLDAQADRRDLDSTAKAVKRVTGKRPSRQVARAILAKLRAGRVGL